MSQMAMQNVIAKLCVDIKFRQAFLSEPEQSLNGFALTTEEVESIKAIDMEAVREYAASLVGKRAGMIRKWMELPLRFLEEKTSRAKVNHILHRYGIEEIRGSEGVGGEWARRESARFCEHLRSLIEAKEIEVPGFEDLLEFQSLKFLMVMDAEVSQSAAEFDAAKIAELSLTAEQQRTLRPLVGSHACLKTFKYNMDPAIRRLEAHESVEELEEGPSWALFYKRAGKIDLDIVFVTRPLKQLIEMLSGEQTVQEIIEHLGAEYLSPEVNEQDFADDCLGVLQGFYEAGIITFIGEEALAYRGA